VADAGILVASVIGRASRGGLYLDVGALHGLFEGFQSGLTMSYRVRNITRGEAGPVREYVLAGPTCDPDDTIQKGARLGDTRVWDRLIFSPTGAYTDVYATEFMGFSRPNFYVTAKVGDEPGFWQECVGSGRETA